MPESSKQDSPALGWAGRQEMGRLGSAPHLGPGPYLLLLPLPTTLQPSAFLAAHQDLQPATSHGTAGVSRCRAQGEDELHGSGTKPGCVKGVWEKGASSEPPHAKLQGLACQQAHKEKVSCEFSFVEMLFECPQAWRPLVLRGPQNRVNKYCFSLARANV